MLEKLAIPAFHTYWYALGYCFFICSLYFSGWLSFRHRRGAAMLLFLPVGINVFRTAEWTLPFHLRIESVRLMNGLYIAGACLIYLICCIREQDPYMKRNRIRTSFVLASALVWCYVSDFIDMQWIRMEPGTFHIESNGVWKYNSFIILWILLFFVFYSIKYGLGIKLRIEEQRNDLFHAEHDQGHPNPKPHDQE